ncbi:MAG TPA: isochorismatase family cysteine hydrolase [Candidatus Binataceae bacterium]|nr:isochorismatase family cysteine hydrolase [Candidatus Binataceae bacterium]
MATLTLPKGKTAILIMDCQNDIVHENGKMAVMSGGAMAKLIKDRNVLGTIAKLAEAGRSAKVPIIHVRHAYRPDYLDAPINTPILASMKTNEILKEGTWGAEVHQELAPQTTDVVITKTRVSAFFASPLEAILSAQGITHLVLTGIATDGVVEGTARDAVDRGYYVVIPDDCCMSFSEEGHRATLRGVLGMLTTVSNAAAVSAAIRT